jgi:phosphatidate cytidylyltransferase
MGGQGVKDGRDEDAAIQGARAGAVRGTAFADLAKRAAVAVVGAPVVAWAVWLGGIWSALLFAAAAALAAAEYYRLTLAGRRGLAALGVVASGALPLLPALAPARAAALALATLTATAMSGWSSQVLGADRGDAPTRVGHLLAGVLFASAGLFALSCLRMLPQGASWVGLALVLTWGNDTAAYFGGKALGRHKLLAAVSPGKTWEGAACGLVGALILALALRPALFPFLGLAELGALAAIAGVVGPLGDLAKSVLKRAYHVKDSGHLLPGHGGVLDRIDALLFNAPWLLAYAVLSRTPGTG